MSIDTACSSSLVACHLACTSFLAPACPRALVAGALLALTPSTLLLLPLVAAADEQGQVLQASTSRCEPRRPPCSARLACWLRRAPAGAACCCPHCNTAQARAAGCIPQLQQHPAVPPLAGSQVPHVRGSCCAGWALQDTGRLGRRLHEGGGLRGAPAPRSASWGREHACPAGCQHPHPGHGCQPGWPLELPDGRPCCVPAWPLLDL